MKEITFNFEKSAISADRTAEKAKELSSYNDFLKEVVQKGGYSEPESFLNLIDDDELLANVVEFAKKERGVKYAVVAGIGGSNLGARAVYEALITEKTELSFTDTLSVRQNSQILSIILSKIRSPKSVLLVGVTKSGTTTETIANIESMAAELTHAFGDIEKRIVVVTREGGKSLSHENIEIFSIPSQVSGRFSVFSAVGLIPLALSGINIEVLLAGARDMRDYCLAATGDENPALISAATIFLHKEEGRRIHNTFVWNPELESFGKWYSQLISESLGKRMSVSGKEVREGITPLVSIGSNDLHSLLQLYMGGPKDKFTTFVRAREESKVLNIPEVDKRLFPEIIPDLAGKKISDVMEAIYGGVKSAYAKEKLPFAEIKMEGMSEYTLGALLQMKMLEVIYLGKLLKVNPFDQPEVESYKEEVRKRLANG